MKKLFILGLIEDSQENDENVLKLWSILDPEKLKFKIASDLKLINILCGLSTHASSHPCCYCMAHKSNLGVSGNYRSLGMCLQNFKNWKAEGIKKTNASKFNNCINPPIISGDEDDEIIYLIPSPELHIMIGVVNKLYTHMLEECQDCTLQWAKMCNVTRQIRHGSPSFAGNACRKLLNSVDKLRSIADIKYLKYVECFSDFNSVVNSCFSQVLNPEYVTCIQNFRQSYSDLQKM